MLTKDKLPNNPLNGPELKAMILHEVGLMCDRDHAFQGSVAYRRVAFTITITADLGFPHEKRELRSRVQPDDAKGVTGEAPLPPEEREDAALIALRREVLLENPNLDRISRDMPIITQRAAPPIPVINENNLPGEPPASLITAANVETIPHKYDKTQFPSPAAPVDSDVSESEAARLGVAQRTGAMGLKQKEDAE